MGRPLRIEYPGALYYITSRGNERKKIFLEDADKIKFIEILEDYHNRFNILINPKPEDRALNFFQQYLN